MTAQEKNDPIALAGIGACPAFLAVVEQARELARIVGVEPAGDARPAAAGHAA